MKIGIGNDHTAVEMRNEIKAFLEEMGHEVVVYGFEPGIDESTDYPIYGERVGRAVANGEIDGGVLICGTGIGISLAANKVKGVRAAVCSEAYSARLTKIHNNANIIAFGVRVVGSEVAKVIVSAPFAVSGTAALTGVYKAYEDITGQSLSSLAKSCPICTLPKCKNTLYHLSDLS